MKFTKETVLTYIEPRIRLVINTGCWEWTRRLDRNGYACMDYKGPDKKWKTAFNLHRIVYQAFNGDITTSSLVVSHKCNNRCCINPAHLELTTQKKNVGEQIRIGTHASTMKNRRRKTPEESADIIARLQSGESSYSIAKSYDVTITNILRYKKHLTPPPADQVSATITETITFKEA